jgi:DNA repair protein RadA/Sms
VAAAIASSVQNTPVSADCVMLGEIGLSGELRSVGQAERRLNEAAKLGFRSAIVPRSLRLGKAAEIGVEVLRARSIGEALDLALKH